MARTLSATWTVPWMFLTCLALAGCQSAVQPEAPLQAADQIAANMTTSYDDNLRRFLGLTDGIWHWEWTRRASTGECFRGSALLQLSGLCARWQLLGAPGSLPATQTAAGVLCLEPLDSTHWHTLKVAWPPRFNSLLPLPRLAVQSAHYADLLHLLQELTTPRFERVVHHWPGAPIPVRAGPAVSGEVDLAACLRDAMTLWNDGEATPLFAWDPHAVWGIRLVHFPGTYPRPVMAVKVVRLDGRGNPLTIHIQVGDAYDIARHRRHAVRALVHELAHALLLWGHSEDRRHVLWRCGPIVALPSQDERRAAHLLARLPAGLDLSAYDRSMQADPPWHQDHRAPVEERDGRQSLVAVQNAPER